jgi:predicted lipoprotein with Yx(FWY)xxD motif
MRLLPAIGIGVIGIAAIAAAVVFLKPGGAGFTAEPAALSTPPGVTLQTARTGGTILLAMAGISIPATGLVYADAKGMTLYVFDKDAADGKSACAGDCAKAWPALAAPADAKPFGDWSIVTRDDGSRQWALRGKPLYTSVKDRHLGDGAGNNADEVWHIALFKPAEGRQLPDGVDVQEASSAAGQALVNDQNMPLYVYDGDRAGQKPTCVAEPCATHWAPYAAAQLARPLGDFTVVDRGDGVFQWAFKGRPLYVYDGDALPGDANGNGADGKWHVALVERNYMPPGVTIRRNNFGAPTLATADGMSLYVRDRVVGTNTGHNLRAGSKGFGMVGRMLGTAACDAECAKVWKPLAAAPDAQPQGFWEVATRADGTRQWTYRGFAVYSYANDKKPGDMLGNDEIEIMDKGDPFKMADLGVKGMGALFWHTATP